jgi:hypothetical protein
MIAVNAQIYTKKCLTPKNTYHIIQLAIIRSELKQSLLPRMYCSEPLDSFEHILFYAYLEMRNAILKNGVKIVKLESFSDK